MANNTTTLIETGNYASLETAIRAARRAGVTRALELIKAGRSGRAEYELGRSVMAQARMAGLGNVELPVFGTGERR